jgi:hypothetical protein
VAIEKLCKKCLKIKPIGEFYRHSKMSDGHLSSGGLALFSTTKGSAVRLIIGTVLVKERSAAAMVPWP